MPAGGARNPALGRLWDPAGPALGPVCEELAELQGAAGRVTPAPAVLRKRGLGLSQR